MSILKHIERHKKEVIKKLLPDTCTIMQAEGDSSTIVDGIVQQGTRPLREYNGSTDIPCRLDIDRAFRPDKFKTQATTVDEYTLEIPVGIPVLPADIVTVRTSRFIIRKIKNMSNWDVTIECTVVEVGTDIDYGQSS